jgi:putative membrane protein
MKILKDRYQFRNKEKIILRDYLALERTRLANERTFFAYIRTFLYLILAGFAFLQIEGLGRIQWLGYLSLGLSIIILLVGTYRFYRLRKNLRHYYSDSSFEENEKSVK